MTRSLTRAELGVTGDWVRRARRISTNTADANDLVDFTLLKAYVGADRWTMRAGC